MLYYSGAIKAEGVQINPSLSLGGFKSSSMIANEELYNLFPKIDQHAILNKKKIMRMIIFANTTGQVIENLKIWAVNGEYSAIQLAFVLPTTDPTCLKPVFEKIQSEIQSPYQATFGVYSKSAPFATKVEAGQLVGIWIRRDLILDKFTSLDKGEDFASCEEAIKFFEGGEQNPVVNDQVQLYFEW